MSRETLNTQFWKACKILRQDDNTNSLLDYVEQISWLLFLKCFEEFASPIERREEVRGSDTYRQIGVRLWGNGAYDRGSIRGTDTKYKTLCRMATDDIVVNKIWARNGSVAVVPPELDGTFGSGEFPTFAPDAKSLHPRWFHWITQWKPFWAECDEKSRGATGKNRIKPSQFLEIEIPLPPLPEQRRIVAKIDQIAARVEEAKRLAEQIDEEQTALLLRRVEELSKGAPVAPMAEVAPVVRRPVEIQPDEWYPELGIRSFGNGLFEKPRVQGCEWTWQRPYWMSEGDLLFSNIKAWEGAVAVIPKAFDGYVGSHRYITCRADLDRATPEFLWQWFLSYEGLAQLGGCSPGATDRNRTLGLKKLKAIEVPLPPIQEQREFGNLIKATQRARTAHQQTAVSLEALMPALLDQAFRGEL